MDPLFHGMRLDAGESIFVSRELENVSKRNYEVVFEALKARSLLPTEEGVPEWASVHRWEMTDVVGKAEVITDHSTNYPRADALVSEGVKIIKDLGSSYGYTQKELKQSAAMRKPLPQSRAKATRRAIAQLMDKILAVGLSSHNLDGLLTVGTGSFTAGDKAAGGKTWGTMTAPNATGKEIANDLMGIALQAHLDSKENFDSFTILVPPEEYATAASQFVNADGGNVTALQWAKAASPYIEDVIPWSKCNGDFGSGDVNRMAAYPRDSEVVAAIVPQEYREEAPQRQNMSVIVHATASCGGVVTRHPDMIVYCDDI